MGEKEEQQHAASCEGSVYGDYDWLVTRESWIVMEERKKERKKENQQQLHPAACRQDWLLQFQRRLPFEATSKVAH